MPFQPGQSGNPGGRPKVKLWRDALMMELKAAGEDFPELRKIARKTIDDAIDGDKDARREIAERLDGKIPQAIIGDDDEAPINLSHGDPRDLARAVLDIFRTAELDSGKDKP